MALQNKVLKLKLDAAIALRHASFWEKQIQIHGEEKATAFYTHLGLNHLEKKSIEYEGIPLSREPKEHEKIAVKGIHGAQESAKVAITKLLLETRSSLISDGLEAVKKLPVARYHELTLSVSPEHRQSLRDRLIIVYQKGRDLVSRELTGRPKGRHVPGEGELRFRELGVFIKQDDEEFDDLDTLTDITSSTVSNDVQSRITAAAAKFTLLGLVGAALWKAVRDELNTGSVSYVERAAAAVTHKTIGLGRADEMQSRADEIDHYEYSAIMDVPNTCDPCASYDGDTANSLDDLPETPLADCDGGGNCRCFIVAVSI